MGTEIPLWIGGLQKWVTGVTKQTTCEDIVKAVISANSGKTRRDHKHYHIVERWHKVEKPLDPRSRLLKVWNTWGLEQCNVRFLLKRAHHAPTTPKAHRRKSSGKGGGGKTWHPRKLRSESEDDGGCCLDGDDDFPATEEQLRNLVASQNDAIAAQLQRLRAKDEEIEAIEGDIHAERVSQIGANYVLDTYLRDDNPGDAFDHCIELYEKVLKICDQVHAEELTIKELTHRLEQSLSEEKSVRLRDHDHPEIAFASPERLEEILARTRGDIERLMRISQTQQLTIQQNERTLVDCAKIIEDKHLYLQHLKADLDRLDGDNARLQEEFRNLQVIVVQQSSCEAPENGDSNSDTGLSSLHSSSDDGNAVLDTLV